MSSLLNYRKNIYSQNGEDGIIRELFSRLDINNGWFVEFGAWDGKYLSNTFALVERGWKGVEIEGDKTRFLDLQKLTKEYPDQIFPVCAFVSESGEFSLESILEKTPIPHDFELLSIDIDSYDYQI